MKNVILGSVAAATVVLVGFGVNHLNTLGKLGGGLKSRLVCNEVFIGGRNEQDVLDTEFDNLNDLGAVLPGGTNLEHEDLLPVKVDYDKKEVTSGLGLFGQTKSVYREGYGCILLRGNFKELPPLEPVDNKAWTVASPAKHGFDETALNAALDEVFDDPLPYHRGMVFIKGGELVAERYAPGFDKNTPMLSNSMAKTVTQMMVGAAKKDDLFDLDDRPMIEEWSGENDPRRQITWRHLLQMQTGLEFQENYTDPFTDISRMFLLSHSQAQYAIDKPLAYDPGTHWAYATGTSNILQRALRLALEDNGIPYHSFARDRIFEPLGAASAVFVPDSSGEFVGGSIVYATARDWAKLGQLFLQDGVWEGERIFPEGWVEFSTTRASASHNRYGAQLWLNLPSEKLKSKKFFPILPDTAYWFSGYEGQVVLVVPSLDMVIVHLGRTNPERELVPINAALELVMSTLISGGE
ncbi:MAG: serine hydrolase [Pseudomonadota bacterium]